jgi:hypothetical protein
MTADGQEPDISADALASHAQEMMRQEWWGIFAAEASLPPCPICGDRQALGLDGHAVCESGPHRPDDVRKN